MTNRVERSEKMVKKIKKEEQHERNIQTGKKFFKIGLIFLIIFVFWFYYMRFIETGMLFVEEVKIESSRVPASLSGLKVVQFSDLHYLTTFDHAYLDKLVSKINLTKPDIVVFTGDLLDSGISYRDEDYEDLINVLTKIECEISKYYVKGEEDYKVEKADYILSSAGFINLTNESDVITSSSFEKIEIHGFGTLSDEDFIDYSANSNTYSIALFHEADMILKLKDSYFDLALAGHSHGNQIHLGFMNQIFSKENAKEYVNGLYKLDSTTLFVNSGIGTSKSMKLRFLTPPSISLFRIVSID